MTTPESHKRVSVALDLALDLARVPHLPFACSGAVSAQLRLSLGPLG